MSRETSSGWRRVWLTVALSLLAARPAPAEPVPQSAEDTSCQRYDVAVHLFPGEAATHHVAGWLCARAPYAGQTIVLASPTGLSTHAYWDWPVDKDAYSFVRHATAAGYAVFNYDRIGTGESERPAALLVNLYSEAFLLHELVGQLRAGAVGGVPFGKVVLLGNSLGSLISIFEAELFHDVDGLINTGAFVGPSPVGLAELFASFYPAQLDPKFAGDPNIPLGYATTMPGSRAQFFHLPAAEPATLALDEQLKDTATVGEATTFPIWIPFTRLVNVPVLSVMGDHDGLFCLTECEPGGIEATKERLFWSAETCLEIQILPDTGHFVQLHRSAAASFATLVPDWLGRRVGVDDQQPATQPCAD
ncbi:MAG: alpha/beta hydrolase [Candidatus Binatia bacterium]